MQKRFWYGLSVMAVGYLLLMSALIGEAPIDSGDDYQHIAIAAEASWSDVLKPFFLLTLPETDPISANKIARRGSANHALTSRVGQTLVIKCVYSLFGSKTFPYYFVQLLTAVGCMALLAWLVFHMTGSYLLGWFSALFYALLPPAFLNHFCLSDGAEIVHFCTLLAFVAFLKLHERWGWGWLIIGLCAMHLACQTKLTGYVIPFMFMVGLFMMWVRSQTISLLLALGGMVTCFLMFGSHLHLDSIPKFLLMNVANEFEPEKTIALFNFNSIVPVSVARNFNLFFCWLAIFLAGFVLYAKRLSMKFMTCFILIWGLVQVAGFAMINETAPRYLTDAMLPLIILFCVLINTAWGLISRWQLQCALGLVFISGLMFHVTLNFQHLMFLRNWKASYYRDLNWPAQVILNDLSNRPLTHHNEITDLVAFAWPGFRNEVREKILPDFLASVKVDRTLPSVLAFSDISDLPPSSYKTAGGYGISFDQTPREGFEVLTSISRLPSSPILRLKSKFDRKHKDRGRIWVFKRTQ